VLAQLVETRSRKVAGSIPDVVVGIFVIITIINIIIIINNINIIIINCNLFVTRWQWLFYMYTNMRKCS